MHTTIFSTHGLCAAVWSTVCAWPWQSTLSPVFSEGSYSSLRDDPASSFPLAWWVACWFECTLFIMCSFAQALIRPGLWQVLLCLHRILVMERRQRPNLVHMIYLWRQQNHKNEARKIRKQTHIQARTPIRKAGARAALDKKLSLTESGSSRIADFTAVKWSVYHLILLTPATQRTLIPQRKCHSCPNRECCLLWGPERVSREWTVFTDRSKS